MEENSKLNNKYQKIDVDKEIISETASQSPESDSSPDKGSRKKQPKEKKVKEKKVKEPKPKKEKKVKEPKPEKPKKEKKEKAPKEPKPPKEKKIKEPKVPKEKKVKEPKPPKVKKEKPPKVKKEKAPKPEKVKKVKEPKEKKPREPLKTKDFVTIGVAVLALLLIAGIFALKHFSETGAPENPTGTNNAEIDKMAEIQVAREGVGVNLVQSDIPAVFYGFSADYKLQYYQFINGKMVPVKSTGTVTALVDMGNETLPVTINYVELGDRIFGIGLFRADRTNDVYFYDKVVFKLTNLPKSFKESGKALLLASIGDSAVTKKDVMWSESFTLDLATGATSRFLKIINRTIDMNGAGVQDFCMLPEAGYKAQSSFVPFITAREYEADSGKQDIFIKQGAKETLFASDVYGKFFLTEGETVTFMRKTTTGFDVVKKTGETEEKFAHTMDI